MNTLMLFAISAMSPAVFVAALIYSGVTFANDQKIILAIAVSVAAAFSATTYLLISNGRNPVITSHWGGIGRSTGGFSADRSLVCMTTALVAMAALALSILAFSASGREAPTDDSSTLTPRTEPGDPDLKADLE